MKIWKLRIQYAQEGMTVSFHSSRQAAAAAAKVGPADPGDQKQWQTIEPVEFKLSKRGVLTLLERHAPYHDNG